MWTIKKIKGVLLLVAISLLLSAAALSLSKSTSYQLFGNLVNRLDTERKLVALTFDDGPVPGKTEQILAILAAQDVDATFYLVGRDMATNMTQARAIVAAGHELGNHSFSHQRMVFKSLDFIRDELEPTNALIRQAGFVGEISFRPPYGKKLLLLPYYLLKHDVMTVTWDVAPDSDLPPDAPPEALVDYVIEHTAPGSIILLHVMFDSRQNSMAAVPGIIRELKRRDYQFVTVSQLLAADAMSAPAPAKR